MGYKLAGFNVIGGVDIDPKMVALYKKNHRPQYSFADGIIEFNKGDAALFRGKVDVLDGSPPCTPFSMAGDRDKSWGVEKKFREGQASQVLDDLFFHFIETARLIQPKVVIAENVKGMLSGNARGYVKAIARAFNEIGYSCKIYLLCASRFGVPQRRERVFFVASRSTGTLSFIECKNETVFEQIDDGDTDRKAIPAFCSGLVERASLSKTSVSTEHERINGKNKYWGWVLVKKDKPTPTICSAGGYIHWKCSGMLTDNELRKAQTFPSDYDFDGNKTQYVTGMSVPPRMMEAVARSVKSTFFDNAGSK